MFVLFSTYFSLHLYVLIKQKIGMKTTEEI